MTAEEYIRSLETCGWFQGLPDAARERIAREVGEATADDLEPWINMPTYLESDEVDDPLKLLAGIAGASYGLFDPADASVTKARRGVELSFTLGGAQQSVGWSDSATGFERLIALANATVSATGTPLRFLQIADEEAAGLVLTNLEAFKAAQEKGLMPEMPGEGEDDEEWDE
jgi:hypothetical protein